LMRAPSQLWVSSSSSTIQTGIRVNLRALEDATRWWPSRMMRGVDSDYL
jgi:hypothetical protein